MQMLSDLGRGTPEDPGGDFSMSCWIDAPDKEAALAWGHVLLGDYYRARFAYAPERERYTGSPLEEGEILEPDDLSYDMFKGTEYACSVGEIPTWRAPWRLT